MFFTVIIATCGRPERLKRSLDAIKRTVDAAGGRHHLIVADNAPDYSAESVVREFAGSVAWPVRYLKTPPLDKSNALNAAICVAETDWLAFTDDDTVPEPTWLSAGADFAAKSGHRIFGGRVMAGTPDKELPRWLRPGVSGRIPQMGVFVNYDPLDTDGTLGPETTVPYGANVFVMKRVFTEYGGYDERLWALCGRRALGAEDSEFGIRVRTRGEAIGYCRAACVLHPVHYERGTLQSHLRWAYYYGWREPMIFFRPNRPMIEKYMLRLLARRACGTLLDLCRNDPAGAVDHLINMVRVFGSMVGRFAPAYRRRQCDLANGYVPFLKPVNSRDT